MADATDFVTVANPEKVGEGMAMHVVYTVRSGPSVVRRRFRDFQWLYERLVEDYEGAIVSPAPPPRPQP